MQSTHDLFTWECFTDRVSPTQLGYAATDRGWIHYKPYQEKVKAYSEVSCCGFYLDYKDSIAGENSILARAYFQGLRSTLNGYIKTKTELGCQYFRTTEEAKLWIEQQVSNFLNKSLTHA